MIQTDWFEPKSLEEAVKLLADEEGRRIYAGGTDVVPLLKYGLRSYSGFVSLRHLQEMHDIKVDSDGVWIGAMVTLTQLMENQTIKAKLPALAKAAGAVASPQIRNSGTIGGNLLQERRCKYFNRTKRWRCNLERCYLLGGNICFQAPRSKYCRALYYSDLAPAMLIYDSILELTDTCGTKQIVFEDLFNPDGTRNLSSQQIMTKIFVRFPHPTATSLFLKYSVRASLDFPVVNTAALYSSNEERLALAVGAAAPAPFRLKDTESQFQEMKGKISNEDLFSLAEREFSKNQAVVAEVEATPRIKLSQARGLIKKTLIQLDMKGVAKC